MSTDANAHISIMFDRSRQARNRRKKRGEPEITLPDPNKGPSTLDLVFAEAKSREEKAAVVNGPKKEKKSFKQLSQKMATMTKIDMDKKTESSQLNNGKGDQYQTPSFKMVIVRPKMDLNRALRIMGYSSAREFMDTAKDESKKPKEELDKKHFAQSMLLMKKKQKGQDDNTNLRKKKMSADDEVRLLHEAYQFLVRKYKLQSSASDVKGLEDDGLESDDEDNLEGNSKKKSTSKDNKFKGKSKKKTFDFKTGPDDTESDDEDDEVFVDDALKPEEEESFGFLRA